MVSHEGSYDEKLKQIKTLETVNNCFKVSLFKRAFMYCCTIISHAYFFPAAGEDVQTVQREVAEILKGRIVVGHAIHNDLKVAWRKYLIGKGSNFQNKCQHLQTNLQSSCFRFYSWIIQKRKSGTRRSTNLSRRL